jgi:hypothetical protein
MPEEKKPTKMSVAKSAIEALKKAASQIASRIQTGIATPGGYLEPSLAATIAGLPLKLYATKAGVAEAEETVRPTQQLGEILGIPYPWEQMSSIWTPTPAAQPTAITQTSSAGATTMVPAETIRKAVQATAPVAEAVTARTPTPTTAAPTRATPTRATPAREVSTPTQIAGIPVEAIRRMAAERGIVPSTLFVPEALPIEARPKVSEEELKKILGRKRARG